MSPGWIDTTDSEITGAAAQQQPVGRVGKPEDIAEMVLFLCSNKAGFITGENICIDCGMTKQMIYHDEMPILIFLTIGRYTVIILTNEVK
ncbi:MAG: SDR family oxidoreductase [Anaerolineaceae bacterium]|nr:SDR family oxidoreductase [Anaerolineaceae bacterium]